MATQTLPAAQARPALRSWLTIIFFMVCLTCSYLDKQIVSILVEAIKRDLGLSDLQIGLLQGFTFSLCHAAMGILLVRVIDKGDRVKITSLCIGIWSFATASCAIAGNFASLLAGRALTAAGEAGLAPAVLSLIRDLFPQRLIARATSIFMVGPYVGMGLALLIGGPLLGLLTANGGLSIPGIAHVTPWRAVFLLVGAPGILLAIVMRLFVHEPRRGGSGHGVTTSPPSTSFLATVGGNRRFYIPYYLGVMFACIPMYAQMAWLPSLFIRVHHLSPGAAGAMIGPVYIIAGIAGGLGAGFLAKSATDPLRRILLLLTCASASLVVTATSVPLADDPRLAILLFAISTLASSLILVLAATPFQILLPSHSIARFIVALNIVLATGAAGFGPFLVGYLTDRVFGGPLWIGQSLALSCAVPAVLGALFFRYAWGAAGTVFAQAQSGG